MLGSSFPHLNLYYPYPDHRFPDVVLTERFVRSGRAHELLTQVPKAQPATRSRLLQRLLSPRPEPAAHRTGSSFRSVLVVASRTPPKTDWFGHEGILFSSSRDRMFSTRTRIARAGDGRMSAMKQPLSGGKSVASGAVTLIETESQWVDGCSLETLVQRRAEPADASVAYIFEPCREWLAMLRNDAHTSGGTTCVAGCHIDTTWSNVFPDRARPAHHRPGVGLGRGHSPRRDGHPRDLHFPRQDSFEPGPQALRLAAKRQANDCRDRAVPRHRVEQRRLRRLRDPRSELHVVDLRRRSAPQGRRPALVPARPSFASAFPSLRDTRQNRRAGTARADQYLRRGRSSRAGLTIRPGGLDAATSRCRAPGRPTRCALSRARCRHRGHVVCRSPADAAQPAAPCEAFERTLLHDRPVSPHLPRIDHLFGRRCCRSAGRLRHGDARHGAAGGSVGVRQRHRSDARRQRRRPPRSRRFAPHSARHLARKHRPHRHEEGLRSGPVRRLHGAPRRHAACSPA